MTTVVVPTVAVVASATTVAETVVKTSYDAEYGGCQPIGGTRKNTAMATAAVVTVIVAVVAAVVAAATVVVTVVAATAVVLQVVAAAAVVIVIAGVTAAGRSVVIAHDICFCLSFRIPRA